MVTEVKRRMIRKKELQRSNKKNNMKLTLLIKVTLNST